MSAKPTFARAVERSTPPHPLVPQRPLWSVEIVSPAGPTRLLSHREFPTREAAEAYIVSEGWTLVD